MSESLLSVGIDVGTSTTQLVFSRLHVANEANAFSVPQFAITEKEILYRSRVHFTPLLSDTQIDAEGVRRIVDAEYARAGIEKSRVQTGAVIITGETARKENAREVLNALSGYAGDFVVATAGPALESVLAGKGSGAATYSQENRCAVVNLDIGGGTTNFAHFENGQLSDTGCLNVGGRLMKFENGRCVYLSPVLRPYFNEASDPKEVANFLAEILEQALGLREGETYRDFITDKLCKPASLISFSGGVADLIDDTAREDFLYGDLGVLLGRAIFRSRLCQNGFLRAKETIRATVIGAGMHTTELSGSTVFYQNIDFPLKNLPVAALSEQEEGLEDAELRACVAEKMRELAPEDGACVLALHGKRNPKFSELCKLADDLAEVMGTRQELILSVQSDTGKALGQALHMLLPEKPILCLDGLHLPERAYLDVAAPIANGQVLPVVIKTLVL